MGLEGWKPTVEQPVVCVKLNLEVFPLDRESSERLDQYKRHLASEYASKDKILETKVTFSVKGQTILVAGADPITITAYDPKFEEEANSGCCCFGRPGVKRVKVTVIKKFLAAPLHISGEGNGLVPPSVNGHPSPPPQPSVGGFPQQQVSAPPLHAYGRGQYASQVGVEYPAEVKEFPPSSSDYPPASALGYPPAQQDLETSQYPPTPQYSLAPQYPQASPYPPASQFPPLAPASANQNWSQTPPDLLA